MSDLDPPPPASPPPGPRFPRWLVSTAIVVAAVAALAAVRLLFPGAC